ncbi:MAG: hypothetical protein ACE5E5_10780 [Phycisphaerae bacterium]
MRKTAMAAPVVALALNLTLPSAAAQKIYWVNGGFGSASIQRADLDGSHVETIPVPGVTFLFGIDIDSSAGKMYWSDAGTGKVQRANLDGSGLEDVATLINFPTGIAVDADGGKVYWANEDMPDKIHRADLDGANGEVLISSGIQGPSSVALDPAGGKVYWAEFGGLFGGNIKRANLDGTGLEFIVNGMDTGAWGLALDVAGGKMYWTQLRNEQDQIMSVVNRANLDGSSVETLVTGTPSSNYNGIALDLSAGKM